MTNTEKESTPKNTGKKRPTKEKKMILLKNVSKLTTISSPLKTIDPLKKP